jgi:hypothetical protein
MQNDLTTKIPPRRELPFKRSSTAFGHNQNGTSSKPSNSTLDLPPLPKPHFVEKNATTSTQPRRTKTVHGRPISGREDLSNGNQPVATSEPESCRHGGRSKAEALGDWSVNVQVGEPDQVRPNTSHGAQPGPVQFVMPSTVSGSSSNAAPDPPPSESFAAPLKDALERIRPHLDPISNEKDNLASYATLPNEERMRILEDHLIHLIGYDSFLQLCEDLNACWERIGVGI